MMMIFASKSKVAKAYTIYTKLTEDREGSSVTLGFWSTLFHLVAEQWGFSYLKMSNWRNRENWRQAVGKTKITACSGSSSIRGVVVRPKLKFPSENESVCTLVINLM